MTNPWWVLPLCFAAFFTCVVGLLALAANGYLTAALVGAGLLFTGIVAFLSWRWSKGYV